MYHSSVCRASMRQRRPLRVVHGQCGNGRHHCSSVPIQRSKFDPLSLYGAPHGLSFDPTNTQALLSAVSALQSTQDRRRCDSPCGADHDPAFSNSCSSNNSDTNSFTRSSTPPPRTPPCLAHSNHGRAVQSMARDSSGSHTPLDAIPSHQQEELFSREEFLRERTLQNNLLEETTCFLQQEGSHRCPREEDFAFAGQVGVGRKSSTEDGKPRKHRKDLTWIDWGWPGTLVACPFNQQRRLELDDSLIRPERISEKPNCFESLANCCKLLLRQLCAPACCSESMVSTAVDVKELATSYVFIADIPGLKHTDVKVQVENDKVLRISGERRREDAVQDGEVKYVRVERSAGKFMRKFNLPANANLDAITAACQDGLLTIIVPKTPPPDIYRPRTFDVNVTSADLGKS